MSEKEPSKAEILKMAIDGLTDEEKAEFAKLIGQNIEPVVKNKIELQVG